MSLSPAAVLLINWLNGPVGAPAPAGCRFSTNPLTKHLQGPGSRYAIATHWGIGLATPAMVRSN